jgi:hypothetical protein
MLILTLKLITRPLSIILLYKEKLLVRLVKKYSKNPIIQIKIGYIK